MMTTTLSQSDLTNKVLSELTILKQQYPAINIDEQQINNHIDSMYNGFGIRILNAINQTSLGVFVFYHNDFYLIIDSDGFAHKTLIDEQIATDLLALFYSVRALTVVPKLYSKAILEKNQQIVEIVKSTQKN